MQLPHYQVHSACILYALRDISGCDSREQPPAAHHALVECRMLLLEPLQGLGQPSSTNKQQQGQTKVRNSTGCVKVVRGVCIASLHDMLSCTLLDLMHEGHTAGHPHTSAALSHTAGHIVFNYLCMAQEHPAAAIEWQVQMQAPDTAR